MITNMYEGRETNIIACMLQSHTVGGGGRATCGRKKLFNDKAYFCAYNIGMTLARNFNSVLEKKKRSMG